MKYFSTMEITYLSLYEPASICPPVFHVFVKNVTELNNSMTSLISDVAEKAKYLYLGSNLTIEQALDQIPVDGKMYVGTFWSPSYPYIYMGYRTGDNYGAIICMTYADNNIYKAFKMGGATATIKTFSPAS